MTDFIEGIVPVRPGAEAEARNRGDSEGSSSLRNDEIDGRNK
ncbi:MAG: hypothetical protein ABEN55_22860 [Bradymonadaceae bacterium]